MATDQKRARAGGEMGANGEWYEGGKFIATKDNPKSQPRERVVVADPERETRQAADAAAVARLNAWLEMRRALLARHINALTAQPDSYVGTREQWEQDVENHQAGFAASLGRSLWSSGSLSERQADYAAKQLFGRRSRRNAAEFDAFVTTATEEYIP